MPASNEQSETGNAREYVCAECGAHYSEDVAPAGQCPACTNKSSVERIKAWIRRFTEGPGGESDAE